MSSLLIDDPHPYPEYQFAVTQSQR
jgi:hypothetical protein